MTSTALPVLVLATLVACATPPSPPATERSEQGLRESFLAMIEAGHAMQPNRDTRNVRRLQHCEQTASAHQLEIDVLRTRLDEAPAAYRAQLG